MPNMTTLALTARRKTMLRLLDSLDLVVGVVGMLAGLVVFIAPPPSFIANVTIPGLLITWGLTLALGGVASFAGRLAGVWLVEALGIVSLATGAVIYCITLTAAAIDKQELGTTVAIFLIVIAVLLLVKRYVQLQMSLPVEEITGHSPWRRVLAFVTFRTTAPRNR